MSERRIDRRALGRTLSRIARASVADTLAGLATGADGGGRSAYRLGVTGPPGAGKSTLITRLVARRLARGNQVGVIAIDPTSPYSLGSILGDRVRMDAIAGDPRLFIRSMPSRHAHGGLTDNIADLVAAMAAHAFDDIVIETVGVGQAEYAVRALADTVVLVLLPGSGDTIQAMKAGILETADIYVVNKADIPAAKTLAGEIGALLRFRQTGAETWLPPVALTSATDDTGVAELDAAIERHRAWAAAHRDPVALRRERAKRHVQSLMQRRIAEVLDGIDASRYDDPLKAVYTQVLQRIAL